MGCHGQATAAAAARVGCLCLPATDLVDGCGPGSPSCRRSQSSSTSTPTRGRRLTPLVLLLLVLGLLLLCLLLLLAESVGAVDVRGLEGGARHAVEGLAALGLGHPGVRVQLHDRAAAHAHLPGTKPIPIAINAWRRHDAGLKGR